MTVRLRSVLVAVGTVVTGGALAATLGAQTIPIKAGITVAPDSVRIGDPFRVTVGIRAPRGATIEFPRATDSTSTVQSLDPVVVRTAGDTTAVEQYADYRVAAWDVGVQRIRLADAIVRYNGADRRVPLSGDSIVVRSLLPADTAQRVPKPPRALFELSVVPWWLWALVAAAVVAIGLLVWWWIRRRRRPPAPIVVDPFQRAESEFQRIEALGLLEAGERGRYVTLIVEVLRDYLAARYVEAAALSLTSTELQHAARALPHVPQDRLTRLLTDADLIKFARRPVSTDRAREIGREARAIVSHEHAASHPPASAAPKAAA
ncbi:MAG TPA: hypothetical protein VN651_16040 [Gemmatimonadaceae bacterium]|nr:hypothetical protein [Gemmatimonadaceae bacterium]